MNNNHHPHANSPLSDFPSELPNPPSALPNPILDTDMNGITDLVLEENHHSLNTFFDNTGPFNQFPVLMSANNATGVHLETVYSPAHPYQKYFYTPEVPELTLSPFQSHNSIYYPEDVGSFANVNDTPETNNSTPLVSLSEIVPHERIFRDEATGELYVNAHGEPIGEGAFGVVYEVWDKEGNKAALKVPKPAANMRMIRREAAFLERVKGHDNVANLLGVIEDRRGPCLRMELSEPRDFLALLINRAPLPVPEIIFFAKQLVAGLAYIHKAGIRHCDLKPDNVLVARGMQLKITDFGLAEESHPSFISTRKAGTPGFWAPEVLKEEAHTDKIDIFSLGVMFYMMFTRKMPNITTEETPLCPPSNYLDDIDASEDVKDFLDSTLQFNAEHRISMPELVTHKFLRYGRCPKTLPDTAFDVAPTSEDEAAKDRAAKDEAIKGVAVEGVTADKHHRTSDDGAENAGACKRKKRRAEKDADRGPKGGEEQGYPEEEHLNPRCMSNNKGKEVLHGYRVCTAITTNATTPAQDGHIRTDKKHEQDQDQEEYKTQTTRDEIRRFKQDRRAQRAQWQADLERIKIAQDKMQQDEEEYRDVLGEEFDDVNTSSSSSSGSDVDSTTSSYSCNADDDNEVAPRRFSSSYQGGNGDRGRENEYDEAEYRDDDANILSYSSSSPAPSVYDDNDFIDYISFDSASDVKSVTDFNSDSDAELESGSQDYMERRTTKIEGVFSVGRG